MKAKRVKLLLVSVAFLALLGYLLLSGYQRGWVYYYTVDEFVQQGYSTDGRPVKVSGQVKPGSIQRDGLESYFVIYEKGAELPVYYKGPLPDAFGEDVPVVVEGVYDPVSGRLKAHSLLTKCPSRYEEEIQAPETASEVEPEPR